MPRRFTLSWTLIHCAALAILLSILSIQVRSQQPSPGRPAGPPSPAQMNNPEADVDINIRDSRGSPLEAQALVRLYSPVANFDQLVYTQGSSKAHFSAVPPGDFEVEVTSPGFRKANEHIILMQSHTSVPLYIYLVREDAATDSGGSPSGMFVSPQLQSEMEKGIEALHKQQFETARKILAKAVQKHPENPDLVYYLGLAELGLKHFDLAGEAFKKTISLDPKHELALVSLGELQLQNGSPADAIVSLERAGATGRTTWRASFELASAYFQAGRFKDAETEAARTVRLAKEKGATPLFLLGEIQYAEGKRAEAKHNWQTVIAAFPSDPIIPEAKKMLARVENDISQSSSSPQAALALPRAPEISLGKVAELPWSPPNIDNAASDVVTDINCKMDSILDSALQHLNSELQDFERFTATEHIEHQQIDRYGLPGPATKRDYSYVVFVQPFADNSFYLEETRDGADNPPDLKIPVITTRLNNLGISVLQPVYRVRFDYSCEGLRNLRGQAAWQIRFEEKHGLTGEGVRRWHRGTNTYEVPVKGRIWISSLSYAVLRIESDVREPVEGLELTKDHLVVEYGPVKFSTGNMELWLPWSADMYMELKGKRYHDRHFLSDYMLFGVDTTHKIQNPQDLPSSPSRSSP